MTDASTLYPDNPRARLAWDIITRTGANLFLTGKAGTGKTTFLRNIIKHSSKCAVVAAPTGIAAINARGVTLHSLFQLSTAPFIPGHTANTDYTALSAAKRRLIRGIDLLIIDEVSMVRADLLDAVDAALRRHRDPRRPFGGVQLLLVGDLQQLPPVVKEDEKNLLATVYRTPYFFSSLALNTVPLYTVELETIYRQRDTSFVNLLNKVRDNSLDTNDLQLLNSRFIPQFKPTDSDNHIQLVTHNNQAQHINEQRLASLPGPACNFTADVKGDFNESAYPADSTLQLKVGAQVMFLRNDPEGRYCNGTIGNVVALTDDTVNVRTPDTVITVDPVKWDNIRYRIDDETGKIIEEPQGSFKQLPLRHAWAITVHKSQGLTFDKAIIDISKSFAPGQAYVALSRCRSLEGIILSAPVTASSIICDNTINEFLNRQSALTPDASQLDRLNKEYWVSEYAAVFDLADITMAFNTVHRLAADYLFSTYKSLSLRYSDIENSLPQLAQVGVRFGQQLAQLAVITRNVDSDTTIQQRLKAAAEYFIAQLKPLAQLVNDTPQRCDNKKGQRRLQDELENLRRILFIRGHIYSYIVAENPTVEYLQFLKARALRLLDSKTVKTKAQRTAKVAAPADDILNPKLFEQLCDWRTAKCKSLGVPAFVIASTRALIEVANAMPQTLKELQALKGWGPVKVKQFGNDVLRITTLS